VFHNMLLARLNVLSAVQVDNISGGGSSRSKGGSASDAQVFVNGRLAPARVQEIDATAPASQSKAGATTPETRVPPPPSSALRSSYSARLAPMNTTSSKYDSRADEGNLTVKETGPFKEAPRSIYARGPKPTTITELLLPGPSGSRVLVGPGRNVTFAEGNQASTAALLSVG
jgi:hypothetical protein